MYKSLPHIKLVQVCTATISISQEAAANTYKSLPYSKLVQVSTVQISLSLTGSWYQYVQISLLQ